MKDSVGQEGHVFAFFEELSSRPEIRVQDMFGTIFFLIEIHTM